MCIYSGAATDPEEVAWDDDDDDDDDDESSTPNRNHPAANKAASESTTTLNAPTANPEALKPTKSPRRSHEDENKSVADSDASYDIVSGATSRAAGSPKEEKKDAGVGREESDDDDWE